jgi:hypothetical protein
MDKNNDSQFLIELLARPDREEALGWLRKGAGKHNIGEMTVDESISLIRRLYELGAVEIFVVDIGEYQGFFSVDNLIVTLPKSPAAREALFAWNANHAEQMGLDPYVDEGHDHMFVWFD